MGKGGHRYRKRQVGPFIRFKKNNVPFPKADGKKMTSEDAADLTLQDIKDIIEAALPGSFKKILVMKTITFLVFLMISTVAF
ncbi:MAG: hypothetical protein HY842_03145, partial [Bacteroidetes bacterium]|nr:hypothetical protein [Bacteroidota bacterium]